MIKNDQIYQKNRLICQNLKFIQTSDKFINTFLTIENIFNLVFSKYLVGIYKSWSKCCHVTFWDSFGSLIRAWMRYCIFCPSLWLSRSLPYLKTICSNFCASIWPFWRLDPRQSGLRGDFGILFCHFDIHIWNLKRLGKYTHQVRAFHLPSSYQRIVFHLDNTRCRIHDIDPPWIHRHILIHLARNTFRIPISYFVSILLQIFDHQAK